jgi:hypothetical protein
LQKLKPKLKTDEQNLVTKDFGQLKIEETLLKWFLICKNYLGIIKVATEFN